MKYPTLSPRQMMCALLILEYGVDLYERQIGGDRFDEAFRLPNGERQRRWFKAWMVFIDLEQRNVERELERPTLN